MEYHDFLKSKELKSVSCGFEPKYRNDMLFDWQSDIVRWACVKGKCAIFASCGTGKTALQLQWSYEVHMHTGKPVLILAPLAVSQQTKREGDKFGIDVNIVREQSDVINGINVTNYEIAEHFDASVFSGIVLDESSILKDSTSSTRKLLTDMFRDTPYKLCCTATPSPNDYMELGTHSEFLNIMKQTEMLSTFFCHDGGNTSQWRLKGHAVSKFFEWVASWACCITNPSDLGYDGSAFILPPLTIHEVTTKSEDLEDSDGQMMFFAQVSQTLNERRDARRNSLEDRVKAACDIALKAEGSVIIWCGLNAEQDACAEILGDKCFSIQGSTPDKYKIEWEYAWRTGERKILITKAKCFGYGMNWQHCNTEIFVGLSDSWEEYYQALRRCWRFGQTKPVDVYIVISEAEGCVKQNIQRKQRDADRMTGELVKYTKDILRAEIRHTVRISETYITCERMVVPEWLTVA